MALWVRACPASVPPTVRKGGSPGTACFRPGPCPCLAPRAVPTKAPLLSRIMKTMKVSNQLCSTILKQALRRVHHFFPRPWEMST